MTMLNQAHVEAICSATYLENYLDCLDSLPDELQRILTQIREVDIKIHGIEAEGISLQDILVTMRRGNGELSPNLSNKLHTMLLQMQEYEDEKIALSASLMEFIENRAKQLDSDRENLDPANHMINDPAPSARNGSSVKRSVSTDTKTTASHSTQSTPHESREPTKPAEPKQVYSAPKKRKQKTSEVSAPASSRTASSSNRPSASTANSTDAFASSRDRDDSSRKPTPAPIDDSKAKAAAKRKRRSRVSAQSKVQRELSIEPEEPTYCLCNRISYGEMIGCDNDYCPIEWFHFDCLGLTTKPKGKWYCPKCRGDKPNVMKKADKR